MTAWQTLFHCYYVSHPMFLLHALLCITWHILLPAVLLPAVKCSMWRFLKNFCKLSDTEICFVWHLFCPHLFCLQVFTSILAVALLPLAESYSSFQDSIPNGRNVLNPCNQIPWPGVGHRAIQGGGQKNLFGAVGVFVVLYQVFKSLSFSAPFFLYPLCLSFYCFSCRRVKVEY